jgi:hypothetical protein
MMIAGLMLGWSSFGASASTISQGVTFTFNDLGNNTLRLTVDNVLNATGNWAPVQFFDAFDIRDIGSFSAATATYNAGPQSEGGALSEQVNGSGVGCNNGGGSSACFDWTPNLTLTNHMVFDIAFIPSGGGLNFSDPHLKVGFLTNANDTSKTGDLLSVNFASDPLCRDGCAVPGPIVGAGLPGLVMAFGGLLAWRRRKQAAA